MKAGGEVEAEGEVLFLPLLLAPEEERVGVDLLLHPQEGVGEGNCQNQDLSDERADGGDEEGVRLVVPYDGGKPEGVDGGFQLEDVLLVLLLFSLVTVHFLDEGSDQGIVSCKGDEKGGKYPGANQARNHHPHGEAVHHNNEHQGEDPHQDHEQGRIGIGLVRASLDEVGTAGPPAEGQEGDGSGEHDHGGKVAGAEADRHLLDGQWRGV